MPSDPDEFIIELAIKWQSMQNRFASKLQNALYAAYF